MDTVTVKTSELIGPALDWAVAECEGRKIGFNCQYTEEIRFDGWWQLGPNHWQPLNSYSTHWAKGGPIIEREKIKLFPNVGGTWSAQIRHEENHPLVAHKVLAGWTNRAGPTPLIAATLPLNWVTLFKSRRSCHCEQIPTR